MLASQSPSIACPIRINRELEGRIEPFARDSDVLQALEAHCALQGKRGPGVAFRARLGIPPLLTICEE